jgi:hypothetical protein
MTFSLFDLAFVGALSAPALDPDAAAYIAAVEAADTQALEPAVRDAINDFVVGCKADGIWAAIKASCILAGARTLAGARVPLVGPLNSGLTGSPTYNRKLGVTPGTVPLSTGFFNDDIGLNNIHFSVFPTTISSLSIESRLFGDLDSATGATSCQAATTPLLRCRSSTSVSVAFTVNSLGAVSRSTSSEFVSRANNNSQTHSVASQTSTRAEFAVFSRDVSIPSATTNTIAFYSIGESLDLALLDARVTALINAFDAAI